MLVEKNIILPKHVHRKTKSEHAEAMHLLLRLIEQLPAVHREVLLMVDVHRHTQAEVVQMVDLPLKTIQSHLCQARTSLRDQMVAAGVMPARPG
jgi:DNA-directed RNA polymerase specialized sigma24 family protein